MFLLNLSVTDGNGRETWLCSTEISPHVEELEPRYLRAKATHLVEELIEKSRVPA